jgi:hypothetical protein
MVAALASAAELTPSPGPPRLMKTPVHPTLSPKEETARI